MADFIFNGAKGRLAYYATLPATSDSIIVIPLEAAGLETDSTLQDYDDLASLLAGTSNEQTTMGRKTAAAVTVAVNDTSGIVTIDTDNVTWTSATGSTVGALLFCYNPDTSSATDSTIIPLTKHGFTAVPSGGNIVATVTNIASVT